MRILVVAPNERPKRVEIPHTLAEMQRVVGGHIQAVYPWKDLVALVCDEEGLINGKPLNRCILPGISGPCWICTCMSTSGRPRAWTICPSDWVSLLLP